MKFDTARLQSSHCLLRPLYWRFALVAAAFRARLATSLVRLAAVTTAATSPIALQQNVPLSREAPLPGVHYIAFSNPEVDTIQYATAPDGTKLLMDVWFARPRNADALRPAIVKVHGGGWVMGARREPELEYLLEPARISCIRHRLPDVAAPAMEGRSRGRQMRAGLGGCQRGQVWCRPETDQYFWIICRR